MRMQNSYKANSRSVENCAATSRPSLQSSHDGIDHSTPAYRIEPFVLTNGERFPLLTLPWSGLPSYNATAFALQMLRGRGLATETIKQALRSIVILFLFLDYSEIDLDQRITEGRILTLGEVEGLARLCHQKRETMNTYLPNLKVHSKKVVGIGPSRKSSVAPEEVDKLTTTIRMTYIAQYISWRATSHLLLLAFDHPAHPALQSAISTVEAAILERRPSARGRVPRMNREGLDPAVVARINLVTKPNNPENPWHSVHVRIRNYLIIYWFLWHGIRRGELAGIRIAHFNSPMTEVQIVRRADDAVDPRPDQPNAKTRFRNFEISDRLTRLTREYILHVRPFFPGAKKHDFLFVADRTGRPLSLSAINKIFVSLREGVKDFPTFLSPHWFRHTWNDNFSEFIDSQNREGKCITETAEQEMRNWLMGWSPNSETAVGYTKRHIRRKANQVSLDMQAKTEKTK